MASIEKRTNNGVDTYWVRWREPGAKNKSNEPFTGPDAELRAERFKIDVHLAGGRWPKLWWPRIGYVTQAQWDAYEKIARGEVEDAAPAAPATPLLPYLRARNDLLSKISAGTRAENLRLIVRYFDPYEPFQAADVRNPETLNADTIAAWVLWISKGERDPDNKAAWIRAPKAPKTVHNAHGLLYQLLEHATRGETPLRRTNPCEGTDLPSLDDATEEEMTCISHHEFELLHAAGGPIAQDMALFAVATGMRFGEITALRVGDVVTDGSSPAVWVRRAWKRDGEAEGGYVIGPPKSSAGRRRIALDAVTLEMLERYLGRAKGEYLFTDARGTHFTHARYYRGHWQPMLYRAIRCDHHRALDKEEGIIVKGKRVLMTSKRELSLAWMVPCGCPGTLTQVLRFHDLRHTWVSWLIAAGVPIPKIAKAAGHDDVKTTYKVYWRLLPELDDQQAEAIGSALSGLRGPQIELGDGNEDDDPDGGVLAAA